MPGLRRFRALVRPPAPSAVRPNFAHHASKAGKQSAARPGDGAGLEGDTLREREVALLSKRRKRKLAPCSSISTRRLQSLDILGGKVRRLSDAQCRATKGGFFLGTERGEQTSNHGAAPCRSLNAIWKAAPRNSAVSRLVRARLVSLGLVIAFGFVLTVSLVVSAALAALSTFLHGVFPAIEAVLGIVNFLLSAVLISAMFASVYKILPDTPIAWRDVGVGALFATALFEGGKYLIALYIGRSNIASSFGAAGALIVLLLWIFYSAQIFLLGAEFTRAWACVWGSRSS